MRRSQLLVERIVIFFTGLICGNNESSNFAVGSISRPHRNRHPLLQLDLVRLEAVTESFQKRLMQTKVRFELFVIVTEILLSCERGKPLAGRSGQALVWRALLSCVLIGIPFFNQIADVALEDFGQVVMAVELVLVGDAGKGLC